MGKTIRGHNQFKDTILINSKTYIDYLERFKEVALSIFEWSGLPDSMSERFLEESLYYTGQASILYTKEYGLINLNCAPSDSLNIYRVPISVRCWSLGFNVQRKTYMGYDKLTAKDKEKYAVMVRNTNQCVATACTMELFAQRLCEAQRTIDVNVKNQKHPFLLLTSKDQELSIRNLLAKIDDNDWAVIGDKDLLTTEQLKCINVQAPYVVDKLTTYKKEIINEALTRLGINNIDYKKERMITSETDSNNELINLHLQAFLIPRQKACEECNKLFGTNIEVKVRSDLHNIIKEFKNSFGIESEELIERVKEGKGVANE